MIEYFFFLWVLSKLLAVILRGVFAILRRDAPTFNRWAEKAVKPALQVLGRMILAFVSILSFIAFFLFSSFISIYCYFAYFNKRQTAQNPETLLKRLYYDRHSIIRKQIAQHPNASVELLQDLARDANAQVRKIALRRLAEQDSRY